MPITRRNIIAGVVVAVSLVATNVARAGEQKPTARAAAAGAKTPEEALRRFMLGVMVGDEKELKSVITDTRPEDLRWLLGSKVPPEVVPQLRKDLETFPIEHLKPGDEINLPSGKKIVVGEDWVGEDCATVRMKGDPLAQRVFRIKGEWRVDPAPIIAARKATAK